jgi:thioesterase domain-containing protein/acyl carrier protein
MVPAAFVFLDKLPLTPSGKIDRKALAVREYTIAGQKESYVAPQDKLELQLVKVWEKVLNRKLIGIHDNFFDLGGHSLLTVRLLADIEKLIGKRLPLVTIFKAPTIKQLANILSEKNVSVTGSSLVPIKTKGSRLPFYCVHGAGGAVLDLYHLARHLSPDQPFFGLQDPRIDRDPIKELTVEELASHYIQEMRMFQTKGPYILGGYCFGAMVAYEMAQQLKACGEEVAALIIIEGRYSRVIQSSRLRKLINFFINRIQLETRNISVRETKEKLSYIRNRAKRAFERSWATIKIVVNPLLETFNIRITPSLIYKIEVLYNSHIKAYRNYKPKSCNGRAIIFKSMEKSFGISSETYLGWDRLIDGEIKVYEVPGLHENIIYPPWVKSLAKKLNNSLEKLNHEY